MGFVNLKEMAKRAKMTEEKVMELVELGVIKPQTSYCHPGDFGDGREIAFYPEEALADIKEGKSKPKPEPEPVPEKPEDEDEEKEEPEEDEATGEPTPEKAEPEPEAPKKEEAKSKGKKTDKK